MRAKSIILQLCLLALAVGGCVNPELPAGGYWSCKGAGKECPTGHHCKSGICQPDKLDAAVKKDTRQTDGKPGADRKKGPDGKVATDKKVAVDKTVAVDKPVLSKDLGPSSDIGKVVLPCTWGAVSSGGVPASVALKGVWGTSETNMFAVGNPGTVAHRSSSGWKNESVPATFAKWPFSAVGGHSKRVFIAAGANILERTGPGNIAKHKTTGGSMFTIGGNFGKGILATGTGGQVYKFDGSSWAKLAVDPPISNTIQGIWGDGSANVWLGAADTVHKMEGATGNLVKAATRTLTDSSKPNIVDIYSSASHVFAVSITPKGKVHHRSPNGQWSALSPGNAQALFGVWGDSITSIWVVGRDGIWFYNGNGFKKVHSAAKNQGLTAIFGLGPKKVWAVGEGGTVMRCK